MSGRYIWLRGSIFCCVKLHGKVIGVVIVTVNSGVVGGLVDVIERRLCNGGRLGNQRIVDDRSIDGSL